MRLTLREWAVRKSRSTTISLYSYSTLDSEITVRVLLAVQALVLR